VAPAARPAKITPPAGITFPAARTNDNRTSAGTLRNGVVTLRLATPQPTIL
jgi:hypothetical protein